MALRQNVKFQLNEVVGAIRKMRNYLPKYYNELLMDQAELRTRPTSEHLDKTFNSIVKLFNTIEEKVSGLSGTSSSDISFRCVYYRGWGKGIAQNLIHHIHPC